jgi:hypothetical protein
MVYDFCEINSVESLLCAIDSGFNRMNLGGMNEAIFFPESYILSFPSYDFSFDAAKAANLNGSITLKAGANGYRFRFTVDTGSFTEPMDENDDGIFYDQLFTISIPKDRPEITWLKHRMSRGRYTLLYRDANGITKALRNLRVKFDLNTGKRAEEYNGHIMYARKAAELPARHWQLPPTDALESIFQMANVQMDNHLVTLPEGWQAGKMIDLPFTPISLESIYATYNTSLILRPGTDFSLNGNTVTLNFNDDAITGSPGELLFFYAINKVGDGVSSFAQEVFSKTASYSSGETIVLSQSPADAEHLYIRMNRSLGLRPGTDFSLSGNVITLNFDGAPTPSDEDVFQVIYASLSSSPLDISGWKMYSHFSATGLASGSIIELPHSPIANSLLIRYENVLQLIPGIGYNLSGNEIEVLFDTHPKSRIDCWYAY